MTTTSAQSLMGSETPNPSVAGANALALSLGIELPDPGKCWGSLAAGGPGHTFIKDDICRCGLPAASNGEIEAWLIRPTGAQRWLDEGDGPFGSRTSPESNYHRISPVGTQSGTYFKTSRTHDGMPVWMWGSRAPEDIVRFDAMGRTRA